MEPGVAGADVVDRDPEPPPPEVPDEPLDRGLVGRGAGLRELDDQVLGLQAEERELLLETGVGPVRIREMLGPSVQEDLAAPPDASRGSEGGPAAEPIELGGEPGVPRAREHHSGGFEAASLRPARERFVTDHVQRLEIDDRLVVDDDPLLADHLLELRAPRAAPPLLAAAGSRAGLFDRPVDDALEAVERALRE